MGDRGGGRGAGRSPWAELGRYAGLFAWGFNTAAALVLGIWGGNYLDRRWGTAPWLAVTGVVLAVTLSLYSLVREISRVESRERRR
ncbi:AtpZ/AtpI family protein [Geochorda subterranea]|uniref:AtpZ/AtpI family protein n=1 Tax=Geochorda subterranea TaxID=3109564 RepID=A0ABZ1BRM0_9FIRM|nr:AtpZ/AtpI family protein [Limnochorda sp. LNt]WRP14827.1 AtpZ/AtpI family protein [Limnochorda sp. LNt]